MQKKYAANVMMAILLEMVSAIKWIPFAMDLILSMEIVWLVIKAILYSKEIVLFINNQLVPMLMPFVSENKEQHVYNVLVDIFWIHLVFAIKWILFVKHTLNKLVLVIVVILAMMLKMEIVQFKSLSTYLFAKQLMHLEPVSNVLIVTLLKMENADQFLYYAEDNITK